MSQNAFLDLHPICQAGLGGLFTWAITAVGASLVFMTKIVNQKMLDAMLGLSGGVMIAASYWSLLAPAIEISEHRTEPAWFPAAVGFVMGGAALLAVDKLLPHLHHHDGPGRFAWVSPTSHLVGRNKPCAVPEKRVKRTMTKVHFRPFFACFGQSKILR